MLGLVGVTSIEESVATVTASAVPAEYVPVVAEITAEPAATAVANPWEPVVLPTVATAEFDELQTTDAVNSAVVLSE